MINKALAKDYITRADSRLAAIEALHKKKSWADVVRESQEAVELALKAILIEYNIDPPRIHDVSQVLKDNKNKLPEKFIQHLEKACEISKELRRDRELAFYGTEDLNPSEFYDEEDADLAIEQVTWVVQTILKFIKI